MSEKPKIPEIALDAAKRTLEEFSVGQRFLIPFTKPYGKETFDIGVIVAFEGSDAVLQIEGKPNVQPKISLEALRTLTILTTDANNTGSN